MAQVQQSSDSPTPLPALYWCRLGHKNTISDTPSNSQINDLVNSYTDPLMVVVSAIMVLLAGLLLVRGRLPGAATTHPTVRFFHWVVFAIFLPLTTYMFSETKKSGEELRQVLILMWMLLAELLRKKLDGVSTIKASLLPESARDDVNQIVNIAWIGYLMYSHVYDAILVILWALGIMKIAHRVAAPIRSLALGENMQLVADYMCQLFAAEGEETAATATGGEDQKVMTECKYVIMGEEKVKRKVGPQGYSLVLTDQVERKKMVTVGDVWRLAETDKALSAAEAQGCLPSFALCNRRRSCRFKKYPLKDLCLSFALYKLLRRRFEGYPSAEAGRPESLQFLLRGLLGDDKDDKDDKVDKGERVFRVIGDELNFLRNYHFSTIPLTLSNLWFFLLNCVLMLVIPFFCFIVILYFSYLCLVNYFFHTGCIDQLYKRVRVNIVYDLIVIFLVIATLLLLEFAEALAIKNNVVYVFYDWVMVCLVCNYTKKLSWRECAIVRWVLTSLWLVKTSLRPKFKFNQHSILEPHCRTLRIFSMLTLRIFSKLEMSRRFLGVQSISVPKEVKAAIVKYLIDREGDGPVPPIGKSVLQRNRDVGEMLLWACESDSAAETIIVWHIATCLCEKNPQPSSPSWQQPNDHDTQANRKIAETLSKYCMYLVALAPELLPDDVAWTETAYKAAMKETKDVIKKEPVQKNEHDDVVDREMSMKNAEAVFMLMRNKKAAEKGKMLGDWLMKLPNNEVGEGRVWKVLAEMWTEIVVYIAPSDNVKSHAQALARGEFITHIWALLSHGGILQWPSAAPPADHDQSPV